MFNWQTIKNYCTYKPGAGLKAVDPATRDASGPLQHRNPGQPEQHSKPLSQKGALKKRCTWKRERMRYAGGFEGRKEKGVNGEITVSI